MISKGGRLRPSPAMVVAFAALFVALAGTAFSVKSQVPGKNGVKSSDIAPKATKTTDLGDDAVTGEKVAANTLTGEKVAPNTLTGADINYGIHRVEAINTEGVRFATARCPAGEVLTGGGAVTGDPADTGLLQDSGPFDASESWTVQYQSEANAGEVRASAFCIPV